MSVQNVAPFYQVEVELFRRVNENFVFPVVQEESVVRIHPLEIMNFCTHNGNPLLWLNNNSKLKLAPP